MKVTTEERKVEGLVQVWAIPKREWVDSEYRYTGEWDYQLKVGNPYEKGAVKVCEHHVSLDIPAGINLMTQAVKTIEEEIKEARVQHQKHINNLQAQINQLLMLSYQPEPSEENIPPGDMPTIIQGEVLKREDSDEHIPF